MHRSLAVIALLAAAPLSAGPVLAADNYPILDGTGSSKTIKAKDVGGGILAPQSVPTGTDGTPCIATQSSTNTCGVIQAPIGVTNTQTNATIGTTNAWQAVLTASATRKGCLLQNQSVNNVMYIFFGASPPSNGVVSAGFQLNPGLSLSCATLSGAVGTDGLYITGTSGDSYVYTAE